MPSASPIAAETRPAYAAPASGASSGRVVVTELLHDLAAHAAAVLPDADLVLGWSPPSPPIDQCVSATWVPSGKASPSSEVQGAAMKWSSTSLRVGELLRDRLDVGQGLVVVGDGLVVPEDRVAVLEAVHEPLDLRPVVDGVEAAQLGAR